MVFTRCGDVNLEREPGWLYLLPNLWEPLDEKDLKPEPAAA